MSAIIEGRGTVGTAKYARYLWSILRGIVVILAAWGFIAFLSGFLHRGNWGMGLPVFVVGTFALVAMTPRPDTLPAIENEGTEKLRQCRVPWSLIAYVIITGVGYNWACVFLAFSRRYAFFSIPVIGVTVLIMASYGAIALLVTLVTEGNWRRDLLASLVVSCVVALVILRLRLFE